MVKTLDGRDISNCASSKPMLTSGNRRLNFQNCTHVFGDKLLEISVARYLRKQNMMLS